MQRSGRAAATTAVLVVLAAVACLATGCGGSRPGGQACPRGAELVPSCGVILGITPPTPSSAGLRAAEAALDHHFSLVHTFHDIDDTVPSAYDRAVVAGGALLHTSIDARIYGGRPGEVTWAAVAAGAYDAALTRAASGLASLRRPVFVTFDHEPDQPAKAVQGTPAEFIAAWRHVHDVFAEAGASNVVWVWVVTGWAGSANTALRMWPGNAYVDWIGWEAYDSRGCTGGRVATPPITFAQAALPFERTLRTGATTYGIDIHLPMMISEAGTALPPGGSVNADWFTGMEQVLRRHLEIRAVSWWDHDGSVPACDYTFTGDATLRRTAARTAAARWFRG